MLKTLTLLILLGVAILSSACNTVSGFGKDMEQAGEAIQRKSSR